MAQRKSKDPSRRTLSRENDDPRRSSAKRPAPTANSMPRVPLTDRNTDIVQTSSGTQDESEADRIARLEAEVEEMKKQRDRVNEALRTERLRGPAPHERPSTAANDFIPRPSNASEITMGELQEMLDIDQVTWNAIHTSTRDALAAARPDYNRNWKAQKPDKFAMAYNAVEEKFPVLRRCEGQWGVDKIAKQIWGNRKSYQNCVGNPSTYHGRRAAVRRRHHRRRYSPEPAPPASPTNPAPTSTASRQPSPGPSQPRPRRPAARRLSSSDLDGSDGLLDFDDNGGQHNRDETGDDEASRDPKGKKRAGPQHGAAHKHRR
ncbi:hypothetical protein C8R43DRAFT_958505 [Mycena crocata]|nr:hypothetical protein C8R43DRAFT_958505 [Mycena crocata]